MGLYIALLSDANLYLRCIRSKHGLLLIFSCLSKTPDILICFVGICAILRVVSSNNVMSKLYIKALHNTNHYIIGRYPDVAKISQYCLISQICNLQSLLLHHIRPFSLKVITVILLSGTVGNM